MSLYKGWSDMVSDYIAENGEEQFWNEYGSVETRIYSDILSKGQASFKTTVLEIAEKNATTKEFAMGFVDGINDSLETSFDLEAITEDAELEFNVNFEKLYFNMLNARVEYLYSLPQWDEVLSAEKRKEIEKEWKTSKTVVKEVRIGRNDPCTCGSGKKYKKCCGL